MGVAQTFERGLADDDFDPRGKQRLDEVVTTEDLAAEAVEAGIPTSDEAPE